MARVGVNVSDVSERHAVDVILQNKAIWRPAILFVFALQAVLTLSHHAWVDEWQALQVAVQTPTIASLFENLRYEGHPPLWYFLLRGVALAVPALWVLPVTAALLAFAAQGIILLKSPFRRSERLMIALGVGQECTQTLIRWNARTDFADVPALDAHLKAAVARNGRFYFLTDFRVISNTPGLVHPLAAFTGSYRGQSYFINVVGRDQPERERNIPACVAGLRPLIRPLPGK